MAAASKADHGALTPRQRKKRGDTVVLEDIPQDGKEIAGGPQRYRVTTQTYLDRYLQRRCITDRQYDAGNRLFGMWRAAGCTQTLTGSYEPRVQGARGEISEHQANTRSDVTKALREIGTRQASVIVHVCFCDNSAASWGDLERNRADDGIVILRLALDSLADHFGMPAAT